ncbi:hypothetical protein MRX96_037858 [Rhipicephalus microplus]
MAIGVRISEFHLNSNSSWKDYVERIELCCAANKLTEDADKRVALLSSCGEETYSLIATLIKTLRPPNADYQSIVEAVKNHINPKPSKLCARYVFSKRDQHDGETVADYVTALRKLAENCGYNDKQLPLDIMLRDRLVFGISDSIVKQHLLAEKNLAFAMAYDLAITAESAANHKRAIGSQRQESPHVTAKTGTQRLKKGQEEKVSDTQSGQRCFRCSGKHAAYCCKFKSTVCFNCSGQGHIAKVCRNKKSGQVNHQLESTASSAGTEHDDLQSISQVTSSCPKFMVTVSIGGETVPMNVDAGAARSIMSEKLFRKLKVATGIRLEEADAQLVTWTKEGLEVIRKATLPIKFKERDCKLPLLVVRNEGSTLIGRDWFKGLNISVTGIHSIAHSAKALVEKFLDVSGCPPQLLRPRANFFSIRTLVCEEALNSWLRVLPLAMSRNQNPLTLGEKLRIIEEAEKQSGATKSSIACDLNIPESLLKTVLAKKDSILLNAAKFCLNRKAAKDGKYAAMETALVEWLRQAHSSGIAEDGAIFKEKAETVALCCGIDDFKASNDWLDHFKKRSGVVYSRCCGESSSVSSDTVENQLQPLDAGVIKCMNQKYRKILVQRRLAGMERKQSGKKLSVLDAMHYIASAWDAIPPETIVYCFRHCDFNRSGACSTSEAAVPVDDEPEFGNLELPGSFADYVGADDVAVCSAVSLDDIIETVRPDIAGTSDDEEMNDTAEASASLPTYADVLCYVDNVWQFSCAHDEIGDLLPDVAAFERKLMHPWATLEDAVSLPENVALSDYVNADANAIVYENPSDANIL